MTREHGWSAQGTIPNFLPVFGVAWASIAASAHRAWTVHVCLPTQRDPASARFPALRKPAAANGMSPLGVADRIGSSLRQRTQSVIQPEKGAGNGDAVRHTAIFSRCLVVRKFVIPYPKEGIVAQPDMYRNSDEPRKRETSRISQQHACV